MRTIDIDFDVFKELTRRRSSEEVTDNDVLRELLGLPSLRTANGVKAAETDQARGDWVSKGVRFPAGTELRAHHKGQLYLARVENGALTWNGERFDSPSAAAVRITGTNVNGWNFWECRLPGQASWRNIKVLRKK
jgi:hypothetical protein